MYFWKNSVWIEIFSFVRFRIKNFMKRQICRWRFWNVQELELIICPLVRFWIKFFSFFMSKSNLASPLVFSTTVSSKQPCTFTDYNVFANLITAIAAVCTIHLEHLLARSLTFESAMISQQFLCMVLISAKTCSNSELSGNKTGTFCLPQVCVVFEKLHDHIETR